MDAEKFFKEMYYNIWQGHDLNKFNEFYADDFQETISLTEGSKKPVEIKMDYNELLKQAKWQKENYKDTTIDIEKIEVNDGNYLSVNFHSSSVEKNTGKLRNRHVCGIWRLNKGKIDRVLAVVENT